VYFISYKNGRKICDGYGESAELILATFAGTYQQDGALCTETKWVRTDGDGPAIYIRPCNDPPPCRHPDDDKVYNIRTSTWECPTG